MINSIFTKHFLIAQIGIKSGSRLDDPTEKSIHCFLGDPSNLFICGKLIDCVLLDR